MILFKKFLLLILVTVATLLSYFKYANKTVSPTLSVHIAKYQNINFNKDGNDVFSFMHIQKTGGTTMEKHLVLNIEDSNCLCNTTKRPSCNCYRSDMTEVWLICRYNQPKWPCGLHPDLTTLQECAPSFMDNNYEERPRRYFYGTILRNPVYRFLSEFRHIQRGASWKNAANLCKGKTLSSQMKSCFNGKLWISLTLGKFLACPYNLAINRQTWMLSNISAVTCDFKSMMFNKKKKKKLFKIAIQNLNKLSYFALLEFPKESQFIFEKTFNLRFNEPFQKWRSGFVKEYLNGLNGNASIFGRISQLNDLDVKLYEYAKTLFLKRYKYFVDVYGEPHYKEPSVNSRFQVNAVKLERFVHNLPQSKGKENILRLRKEREQMEQASQ